MRLNPTSPPSARPRYVCNMSCATDGCRRGAAHTNVPGLECGLKNSAEYEILILEGSYLGDNAVKAGGKIH